MKNQLYQFQSLLFWCSYLFFLVWSSPSCQLLMEEKNCELLIEEKNCELPTTSGSVFHVLAGCPAKHPKPHQRNCQNLNPVRLHEPELIFKHFICPKSNDGISLVLSMWFTRTEICTCKYYREWCLTILTWPDRPLYKVVHSFLLNHAKVVHSCPSFEYSRCFSDPEKNQFCLCQNIRYEKY
jgi:hypothetical protein